MTSIKTKLISLATLGVLSTAVILGGLAIWHLTRVTNSNSHNSLQLICSAEKEHLDITMGNIQQSVDSMKDMVLSNMGKLDTFVNDRDYRQRLTQEFEELYYTIAYHTTNAIAYYIRWDPELIPDGDQGFIWTKRNRFSSFSETELTDISKYQKEDVEHVGWYYIPVWNGKATWMTPYYNKNLGVYMISYVIPLYIRGTLIGIVGMDVDFTIIIDEISQLNVYQNGYAYVTNEQGQVIYHKDYTPGEANISKEENMLEISLMLNNGWNLVVTVPKNELNAERNRLIKVSLLLTMIIATIFIAITIRLTKRIIRPLLELTEATKKIAEGNLDVKLTSTADDEIGILADAFQKTVQHLPEYMYRDSLTGLRNATAYKRTTLQINERIQSEENLRFGIAVLDVNNLKQTNDTYGHETGDKLIISAAQLICKVFSHSPVFRIGGDEFVVILERTDYENNETLLKQLEESKTSFTANGNELRLSIAYGIGIFQKSYDFSYSDVFKKADEAMYKTKKEMKEKFSLL